MFRQSMFVILGLMAAVTLGCEKKQETPAVPDANSIENHADHMADHMDEAKDELKDAGEDLKDAGDEAVEAAEDAVENTEVPAPQ